MLRDVLSHNLDVVFCGTAKGEASARLGFYYAGPGNRFYYILYEAGFTDRKLAPKDCYDINTFGIGLTDLVHNQAGNDNEIAKENYEIERFHEKMALYRPKYIGFTSKAAASFAMGHWGRTRLVNYGLQEQTIEGVRVFVLPSTSGSARGYWDESYWFALRALVVKGI